MVDFQLSKDMSPLESELPYDIANVINNVFYNISEKVNPWKQHSTIFLQSPLDYLYETIKTLALVTLNLTKKDLKSKRNTVIKLPKEKEFHFQCIENEYNKNITSYQLLIKTGEHNQEFDFINLWNTIPKYRFDVDDDKFEKFFEKNHLKPVFIRPTTTYNFHSLKRNYLSISTKNITFICKCINKKSTYCIGKVKYSNDDYGFDSMDYISESDSRFVSSCLHGIGPEYFIILLLFNKYMGNPKNIFSSIRQVLITKL